MADEEESGSVGQDAFSEEILAWMAAGDALATAPVDSPLDGAADEVDDARVARRVALAAARLTQLAVEALQLWWATLPVPRRRNAIAVGAGAILLLGGLAASQASSARPSVAVAVADVPARVTVSEPVSPAPSLAGPKTERTSVELAVAKKPHRAHAKPSVRPQRKHASAVAIPGRR